MNSGELHPRKLPTRDERMLVLRNLIALGNIGVEVVLTVEFRIVSELAAYGNAQTKDRFHRFSVDNRQSAGIAHADGADVGIRALLVRVVFGVAEHFRPRLQFGVNFEPYCQFVIHFLKFAISLSSSIEKVITVLPDLLRSAAFSLISDSDTASVFESAIISGFFAIASL